jgi:pilus assembly protein CpaE
VIDTVAGARHRPNNQVPGALVFVRDRDSEGVIRQSLSDLGVENVQFVPGTVETATAALAQQPSPRLLIVDVSGVADPTARINELANVCEPNTGVVVIGENNDIRLYRELKEIGIAEYFFKPIVGAIITRVCNSILSGGSVSTAKSARTGKLVFVLGVRGGVGATTIAVNTAWHLAEARQRWVMLADLDLQAGDAALQLDCAPSHALSEAFQHPERVDSLFLDRGVTHVTQRLDLLASLEPLGDVPDIREDAVLSLLGILLHHYRYVFVDLPATVAAKLFGVLHLPSTCILVSNASLVAARDVARWREKIGPNTPERSTVHILNKNGNAGSLHFDDFVHAAGKAPDIVIPYHHEIGIASNLGLKGVQKEAMLRRTLSPLLRHLIGEPVEEPKSLWQRLVG